MRIWYARRICRMMVFIGPVLQLCRDAAADTRDVLVNRVKLQPSDIHPLLPFEDEHHRHCFCRCCKGREQLIPFPVESRPHHAADPVAAHGPVFPARNSESREDRRTLTAPEDVRAADERAFQPVAPFHKLPERPPPSQGLPLPHLPFVAHGKLPPATRTPAGKHFPPVLRSHSRPESVRVLPLTIVWLKGPLHKALLLLCMQRCLATMKKRGLSSTILPVTTAYPEVSIYKKYANQSTDIAILQNKTLAMRSSLYYHSLSVG